MIAFFGGTFDPIHLGHIHLAKELLHFYPFSKFYFVPNQQNPLKEEPSASNSLRLKMLQAALQDAEESRFEILENELKREGKSYTLHTLEELKKTTTEEIVLILGDDAFRKMESWFEPKKILESVHCIIVERESNCLLNVSEILRNLHISIHEETANRITHSSNFRWIEKKNISALPFSSREIRKNIEECWNKKDLALIPSGLQHSVWQVIKDNHLYAR